MKKLSWLTNWLRHSAGWQPAIVFLMVLTWCGVGFGGEIHDAAKAGDAEKVKALLKSRSDLVNSRDATGRTPLHVAALFGKKDVVIVLLANKADVTAKANGGQTPLLWAASNGNKDVVALLIENKAEVDAKDNNGWTPLEKAAADGRKEAVELLLANKADINARNNSGVTALIAAAANNHKEVVQLLLANQAEVNAKDKKHGWTALRFASGQGFNEVAELLKQHGGTE